MTPAEILDACRHSPGVRRESRCYPEPCVFVDAPCRACAEAAIAAAVAEERASCRRIIGDSITALRHAIGNNGLSGSPTQGLETALAVAEDIDAAIRGGK